ARDGTPLTYELSDKDKAAPTLAEARRTRRPAYRRRVVGAVCMRGAGRAFRGTRSAVLAARLWAVLRVSERLRGVDH
ncbi:MAG: hypothetical protein QME72_21890, partial [Rhodococcus sp. (in: high G+C Gram-positive bacteria)]|nr:hypothetical protein [Rhodococcus sp. (in: high G+C Gram-positive bacteria)]